MREKILNFGLYGHKMALNKVQDVYKILEYSNYLIHNENTSNHLSH